MRDDDEIELGGCVFVISLAFLDKAEVRTTHNGCFTGCLWTFLYLLVNGA